MPINFDQIPGVIIQIEQNRDLTHQRVEAQSSPTQQGHRQIDSGRTVAGDHIHVGAKKNED